MMMCIPETQKTKTMKIKRKFFLAVLVIMPALAFAQGGGFDDGFFYGMLGAGLVIVMFALYALVRSFAAQQGLMLATSGDQSDYAGRQDHVLRSSGEATGGHSDVTMDVWDDEKDILLNHNYDGIMELDNRLPPWWLALFYVTIAFAVFYVPYYHIFTDWSSAKEYEEEMAAAKKEIAAYQKTHGGGITDETVKLLTDEPSLAEGQKIYAKNCVACHAADGGGGVGPNLTDKYWLHGGGIKNVFHTITNGVPEKGMIAWKTSLTPKQIQQVASYVLVKLQATTPADPKEPQGEPYEPEKEGQ